MLNVKTWIWTHLKNDATLTSLVPVASMGQAYPDAMINCPKIGFIENGQPAAPDAYGDNQPFGYETTIEVHVFVTKQSNTQFQIVNALDAIFLGLFFTITFSSDVPEPDSRLLHRIIRYRRKVIASDLLT